MTNINAAQVMLWGEKVGVVFWSETEQKTMFEFYEEFIDKKLNISPIYMDINKAKKGFVYTFDHLPAETYFGLPGILADSLPDKFGNAVIHSYLIREKRSVNDFNPVEKLCYIGSRGMGALEFIPSVINKNEIFKVQIEELIKSSRTIIKQIKFSEYSN